MGNCEYLKGGYSEWWERLQQSYENRNMYGHEVLVILEEGKIVAEFGTVNWVYSV